MLAIMLPLFITSFQRVRRKMTPKAWKKLQRWACLFYALLCCHILLLTIPMAARDDSAYRLTVFVYGAIFLSCLYYKAKNVEMADLDFMAKVCFALNCEISDLLEYESPDCKKLPE